MDMSDVVGVFNQIAVFAKNKNASDIFINSNAKVAIKIDGKLRYLDYVFGENRVYALIKALSGDRYSHFIETSELNIINGVADVGYFRINVYKQRHLPGLVIRLIPSVVPELDSLNLPNPELLRTLIMKKRGLILVVGATGSGKSTTLAGMLKYRNQNSHSHIITIEDPIEFMHTHDKSVIIQREVGIDTESYSAALKSSLRQAPDVILVGEIRDIEVMQHVLNFAETGHLVLATLHATNSVQALDRIYNFFPREQRVQLQAELANNLVAIIVQRLITKSDGSGRIMAMEVMRNNPYIESLIASGEIDKIPEAINRGVSDDGLLSMDQCIFNLYEEGKINYEEAQSYVESLNDFRVKIRTKSRLPLPKELASSGLQVSVKDDSQLERELIYKSYFDSK